MGYMEAGLLEMSPIMMKSKFVSDGIHIIYLTQSVVSTRGTFALQEDM